MRRSLVLILLAACQSRTELLVGVATDIKAPDTVDFIQLSVTDAKTGVQVQQASWPITGVPQMPYNLPGSYGIYSDGNEAQLDIELVGLKGNTPVITRHSIVSLVDGQTLFYRIGLTAACVGRDDCPSGESCVEGSCRDVNIDSHQLPTFDDSLVTHVTCTSGAQYIDTGTGIPMPPSADADQCPLSQCLEGTCLLPPPNTTRDITGSELVAYIDHGQVTFAPDDLSAVEFAALVPDGNGGVTTIPGHGTSQGQYVIPQVPGGKYFLRFGQQYVYTDASTIDLGYSVFGRRGAQVANNATSITVNATGLDPWSQADALEAQSMEAFSYWFNLDTNVPIGDAATTLSNYTFDGTLASGYSLIQNSDDFELYQMRSKMTGGGVQYFSPSTMLVATPFTQTNGGNTVVSGAFQPLAQDQTLSVMFPASEWETLIGFDGTHATALNPEAHRIAGYFAAPSFAIHAQVANTQYGPLGLSMFNLFLPALPGSDSTVGMTYASPAVPNQMLGKFYQVNDDWEVEYLLPGTSTSAAFFPSITASATLDSLTGPLVPALGPVAGATINGHDMFTAQIGVGTTPTVAWTAPAIGKPGQYAVDVFELTANGAATSSNFIAQLITPELSVQIPPDLLLVGHTYVIEIFCETTLYTSPFRSKFPYASSAIYSAIITI